MGGDVVETDEQHVTAGDAEAAPLADGDSQDGGSVAERLSQRGLPTLGQPTPEATVPR